MKNFGTLFGYELKKIWKRPLLWAAVLVFCGAFVWITAQPFFRSGGASGWAAQYTAQRQTYSAHRSSV